MYSILLAVYAKLCKYQNNKLIMVTKKNEILKGNFLQWLDHERCLMFENIYIAR